MENNKEKAKAQHTTGKHPEPSDNVQSEIETVTPDTENGGLENANKHESQDKKEQASGPDERDSGANDNADEKDSEQQISDEAANDQEVNSQDDAEQNAEQEVTEEPDGGQQSNDQGDSDQTDDGDVRGDVETVSP